MAERPENIRETQRAPRSCFFCFQRKVKCDKSVPCQACRARGQASDCFVETVKVKGQVVISGQTPAPQPTYSQLLAENGRLRSLMLQTSLEKTARPISSLALMDQQEQELYLCLRTHYRPAGISSTSEVIYPSDECCHIIFSQAAAWAWLHSAVSPAMLEQQNLHFKIHELRKDSPNTSEASWLALYFSYLTTGITFSNETILHKAGISKDRASVLRENWYDAALYFLHKADFLRLLDVRNIQTISILGSVFSNFGDLNLYYNLLGCAIRIGESLGINNDYTHFSGILPDLQSQRHLWWSLVILDWLNLPLGQPCISDSDFIVEMPFVGSRSVSESDWCSSNHQSIMSRIALLLYRFQANFCASKNWDTTGNAVETADTMITILIKELMSARISGTSDAYARPADSEPEVFTHDQRQNLLLTLFYYRILINRTMVSQHPLLSAEDIKLLRCLESAHRIINVCKCTSTPGGLPATWSTFLPLYSAANVLATFGTRCRCERGHDHAVDITSAIDIFDSMTHKSIFASYAAKNLRQVT